MPGQLTGADVEQLRGLAQQVETAAQRLTTLGDQLRAQLAAAPWRGPRADDYRRSFTARDLPSLRAASDHLRDVATTLRRNADEQERASGAAGGAAGGLLLLPSARATAFFPVLPAHLDGYTLELIAALGRDGVLRAFPEQWQEYLRTGDPKVLADLIPHLTPMKWSADRGVSADAGTSGDALGGLATYDASARASAEVSAKASMEVSPDGIAASAAVAAMASAAVTAGGRLGSDRANVEGRVTAKVEAGAEANAKASLGKDGAHANVGGSAGAMASVQAEGAATLGPVRATASAKAYAGVGVVADLGLDISPHKIHFKPTFGAAVGVGAGVSADITVDPTEVAHEVADEATEFWKALR